MGGQLLFLKRFLLDARPAGTSRTRVAEVVFSSPEGEQFLVQSYYTQLLHRTADSVGMTASTAALAHDVNEEQILIEIIKSDEYFKAT